MSSLPAAAHRNCGDDDRICGVQRQDLSAALQSMVFDYVEDFGDEDEDAPQSIKDARLAVASNDEQRMRAALKRLVDNELDLIGDGEPVPARLLPAMHALGAA